MIAKTSRVPSQIHGGEWFIKIFSPLCDYLRPEDPHSSFLLTTRSQYLVRPKLLPDPVVHKDTALYESWCIISKDLNVEQLLDASMSPQAKPSRAWTSRDQFLDHYYRREPRSVILGPKIETVPWGDPSLLFAC